MGRTRHAECVAVTRRPAIRTDRIEAYADALPARIYQLHYLAWSVTPGKLWVPSGDVHLVDMPDVATAIVFVQLTPFGRSRADSPHLLEVSDVSIALFPISTFAIRRRASLFRLNRAVSVRPQSPFERLSGRKIEFASAYW